MKIKLGQKILVVIPGLSDLSEQTVTGIERLFGAVYLRLANGCLARPSDVFAVYS
jgi:hypothetical protein